jgi:hypothetical protein
MKITPARGKNTPKMYVAHRDTQTTERRSKPQQKHKNRLFSKKQNPLQKDSRSHIQNFRIATKPTRKNKKRKTEKQTNTGKCRNTDARNRRLKK